MTPNPAQRARYARTALERADDRARIIEKRDRMVHKLHLFKVQLDPEGAARRCKAEWARRRRDLLDPKWADNRVFPVALVERTVADYIRAYESLNREARHLTYTTFVNCYGRGLW